MEHFFISPVSQDSLSSNTHEKVGKNLYVSVCVSQAHSQKCSMLGRIFLGGVANFMQLFMHMLF